MIFRYQIFTITWAILIFIISVAPSQTFPDIEFQLISVDKLVHAFVYAVLVFFMIIGFQKQHTYLKLRLMSIRLAIAIGTAYGVLIEIIQMLLPNRYFALDDMVANTIGAVVGSVFFFIVYKL